MELNDWKIKLRPAGTILLLYFFVPAFVRWLMGGSDAFFGRLTFSGLIQAGFAIAFVRDLFGLEQALKPELDAWLNKFSQPEEMTKELAGKISAAAGFLVIAAIVWPPVGEIIGKGQLSALIKLSALVYAVYLGYNIWNLSEPFMASARAAAPPPDPDEPPPAASRRRCAKCGQLVEDSDTFCSFCRHPLEGGH